MLSDKFYIQFYHSGLDKFTIPSFCLKGPVDAQSCHTKLTSWRGRISPLLFYIQSIRQLFDMKVQNICTVVLPAAVGWM